MEHNITILSSKAELLELKTKFGYIANSVEYIDVNADIEHYLLVVEKLNTDPFALLIEQNGSPVGFLLGRISNDKISAKLGYLKIFTFDLKICDFIFGGVICPQDHEIFNNVFKNLEEILSKRIVDLIRFNSCNTSSIVYKELLPKKNVIASKKQKHHILRLPQSLDDFLNSKSKKHRKNFKYYSKKLINDFNTVKVEKFDNLDLIEKMFEDAEKIASLTYQRGMGVGFKNNEITKSRFEFAAKKGWLRSYILYINDIPVSFQMGFQFRNGYFVQGKGYLPEYSSYRVGTYLFLYVLEDLINDGVSIWDFGLGDAEYKEDYCNEFFEECTISLFNKKKISIFIIFKILSLMNFLNGLFDNILKRLKIDQKIKTKWKKHFQPNSYLDKENSK